MFPNIDAEQARHRHTNEYVANYLNMSRQVYERKKRNGNFTLLEIRAICQLYCKDFYYLFGDISELKNTGA